MASLQERILALINAIGADEKLRHGVVTTTTAATLTPVSTAEQFNLTAQAGALAIAAVSGSMLDGQSILIRIKDNGGARSISWDGSYRAVGVTLPLTTVVGKTLYVGGKYNALDTKVDIFAVALEA